MNTTRRAAGGSWLSLAAAQRSALAGRSPVRPGLTLIEVMLALAIMLIALVGIGKLVDIGTDQANEGRMVGRGTRLAQGKLAEAEAGAIGLDAPQEGTFENDDAAWSWKVEPQQQGAPNLYLVTVTVTRDYRGRPVQVVLSQMVVDPKVMGSAAQAEKPSTTTTTDPASGGP